MSRVCAILNPRADGGRVAQSAPQLKQYLYQAADQAGWEVDWLETQAPEHAVSLAKRAATGGYEMVVAVGGDGTVNEVLNGLMHAREGGDMPTLGIIPVGSGNDFAWFAGLPTDPTLACQRLFEGRTRTVDVGHIRESNGRARYFDNGCGVGFDAQVALEVKKLTRLRGFVMYLVGVLKTLMFHHRAPRLRIRLDEREFTHDTLLLTISNGRRHGGGFLITPEAELDDGLFDICIAGELSRPGMVMIIPRFMRGTHVTHHKVRMDRARQVAVHAPIPRVIHLDGEIFATDARQFEVKIIPGALRLRV